MKKGTHRRQKVTGVSDSHLPSSLSQSKSARVKLGKALILKEIDLTIGSEL